MGLPLRGPGFTFSLQARRGRQAESSSSACGLVPHLRLLSTPPHGDAVTFGFQAGERMPGEDFHLYTCALAGAQAWRFSARLPCPLRSQSPEGTQAASATEDLPAPLRGSWREGEGCFPGAEAPGSMPAPLMGLSPLVGLRPQASLVMVAELGDENGVIQDFVDDPMLFIDTARPVALKGMLQRLWLSDTAERLPHNRFD